MRLCACEQGRAIPTNIRRSAIRARSLPIGVCQRIHGKERDMAHDMPEERTHLENELQWMLKVLIEEEGAEAIEQIFGDFVYIEELDGKRDTD